MRFLIAVLLLCSFSPSLLFASDEPPVLGHAATVELLLERAISQNLIAGGVVVVGNREGILSTAARGQLVAAPGSPLLDDRTVFDVASLTKVVATAPAVMKLLDAGLIELSDPLSRWFPEFAQAENGGITILNLLTHTSGLVDFALRSDESMDTAVRRAAAQKFRHSAVSRFNYADINFILLGELVRRVTGETLDAFCREQIYGPLGARETMFLPPRTLIADVAPTSAYPGGVVQDLNARRLGGVAGHAGVFSSAYDLSRFARLMLGGGAIDHQRILSEQAVAQMTTPYMCNDGQVLRGLGWDISSPYSAPKGSFFSDASFGHTGYSGSSIWIDPQRDLFVILLTKRVDYRNVSHFNQLRRDVSTVAAADFNAPGEERGTDTPAAVAKIHARLLQPATPIRVAAASKAKSKGSRVLAQSQQKSKRQQVAKRRSVRGERQLASKRATTRFAQLAKADKTCKTDKTRKSASNSKKRRKMPRS